MATNGTAPVGVSKNIKQLGRMDLPGGGSVVVENGYAYVGHMDPPHGTSIIDVKDPKNPKSFPISRSPKDCIRTRCASAATSC